MGGAENYVDANLAAARSEADLLDLWHPRAVVVDANILIKEATRLARVPGRTCLVSLGIMQPGILFTTTAALAEAHERMNRLGDRAGVTDRALDVLDEVLTPLLTVVADAPTSGLTCEATLADRDPDDLPTLRLSLWLGGWLLSDDPDLDEIGAVKNYLPLVRNLGYLVSIEFGVNISATALWEMVKWLARRRLGQAVLIGVLTAVVLANRTPAGRERRSAIVSAVVTALQFWYEAAQASERLRVTTG